MSVPSIFGELVTSGFHMTRVLYPVSALSEAQRKEKSRGGSINSIAWCNADEASCESGNNNRMVPGQRRKHLSPLQKY